jgi:hypothetical protein
MGYFALADDLQMKRPIFELNLIFAIYFMAKGRKYC